MARDQDRAVVEEPVPAAPGSAPLLDDGQNEREESLAVLRRMERLLFEIRGRLETAARAERHREFSFARLCGALLQAVVAGFVIAALVDWVYQAPPGGQLVKLAFAGVLQLGALTAFVLVRDKGHCPQT